jgi:hypothetical protein
MTIATIIHGLPVRFCSRQGVSSFLPTCARARANAGKDLWLLASQNFQCKEEVKYLIHNYN